jgi:hypothetical protein
MSAELDGRAIRAERLRAAAKIAALTVRIRKYRITSTVDVQVFLTECSGSGCRQRDRGQCKQGERRKSNQRAFGHCRSPYRRPGEHHKRVIVFGPVFVAAEAISFDTLRLSESVATGPQACPRPSPYCCRLFVAGNLPHLAGRLSRASISSNLGLGRLPLAGLFSFQVAAGHPGSMTINELADLLRLLGPGSKFALREDALSELFPAGPFVFDHEARNRVRRFASACECAFEFDEETTTGTFTKITRTAR